MSSTAGRRLRGRMKGKPGGRRKSRATAKRKARALVRASRPKQKPKRAPKPRSRAARRARAATAKPAAAKAAPTRTKRAAAKPKPGAPGATPTPRAAKSRPAGARASLRVLKARARRRPAGPPAPAFPQASGAPDRSRIMFRMVRARASVLAAVQGMGAAAAERPLGEGKWSCRETILHLVNRDQARLREMEAALRGVRPSWTGLDPERQAVVNEQDLAPLRALSWEDALRRLLTTRQELMEAMESIPEEPADVWSVEHPLGWMFDRLPDHDLHHADIIKRWRLTQGV